MVNKMFERSFILALILVVIKSEISEQLSASDEVSTPVNQLKNEISLNDDEIYTWSSIHYPNPYSTEDQELIIKANNGYFISITVEELELDGDHGDFLLIKPGVTVNDDRKGRIFTYILKSPRKYLMYSNDAYLSFHVLGKNENGKKGFLLKYQRIGEEITTTEEPTTDVTWPTPTGSDSIYLTVYVTTTSEKFDSNLMVNNLKIALVEMATEYCTNNNIKLIENITTKNVHLYYVIQCPYTWPNTDTCLKVHFALPVFVADDSEWTGYQLTTAHLEPMWNQLANKYLEKYNMTVYSVPDNNSSLVMWVVISTITIVLFLVLLYFIKVISPHFSPLRSMKRRCSDTNGIIQNEERMSKRSLGPHPLQVTPPLFDNDYAFQQFEPDVGIPSKTYVNEYPLSEDDSENEIIFTNFSNSWNNIVPENEIKESNS